MRQRKPFTHGGPAVIFAVDDEMVDSLRPAIERIVSELGDEVPYEIVRASELADPNTEAELLAGCAASDASGLHVAVRDPQPAGV